MLAGRHMMDNNQARNEYSIGEFSKITRLTAKTIRFYEEQDVLIPTHVAPGFGSRYSADNKIENGRVISQFGTLDFSLDQIVEILSEHDDDGDILEAT